MDTLRTFQTGAGAEGKFNSLPALQAQGFGNISRLPVSIRIVLESLLRNMDGKKVTEEDIQNLANWNAAKPGNYEVPFTVARVVLQDFTGVPLVVDLAAMRNAAADAGADPSVVEPLVPVDLVIDHSVQVDFAGSQQALDRNLKIEFIRNKERYEFLKWGQQAFDSFKVVPPGIGIVHQVNLEYLAKGVLEKDGVHYFDSLVGTDSHTTMINGLGVVGWGVGGIEAEAAMLGQPVTFLVPEVVGVYLHGELNEGVTATDLTLRITEILRAHGVVGKFVEFYGPGAKALSLPDRATIANMAPEYGATMGFFPVDKESVNYLRGTGRSAEVCQTVENYFKAQEMWGIPEKGDIDYTDDLTLDLNSVVPAVSGPKRPQDRIDVPELGEKFNALFEAPTSAGGFGRSAESRNTIIDIHMPEPAGVAIGSLLETTEPGAEMDKAEMTTNRPTPDAVDASEAFDPIDTQLTHGSVLIAAITSCTNTSNPSVMLAAGLVAKKANQLGLSVAPYVKTSLGPGSRVVTDYLNKTHLQAELDQLGFQTVGYGCTTCIGNSGPLHPAIEDAIKEGDLVCASVLSGNRNFEARVHGSIRANFLMSPPLVVAYALAGRVDLDLANDPIGKDKDGNLVYLKDIWPTVDELKEVIDSALVPEVFNRLYSHLDTANQNWVEIQSDTGDVYSWDDQSTYIQNPPFFDGFSRTPATEAKDIIDARALGIFADSVTTDHISPAGAIVPSSPAGQYLLEHGVEKASFNSFGSRRGNDRVMTRGTFGNVRIKNLMCDGIEGGYTQYFGPQEVTAPDQEIPPFADGKPAFIYDAAEAYRKDGTDLIVIGGEDYGMGSSRDWAAKGTRLLGVSAVITKSFERIHRSNLIGMGVLPLNFKDKTDYDKVADLADATFSLTGLSGKLTPAQDATLTVTKADGSSFDIPLVVRIDTPAEVDYYLNGGILPYVLNQILDHAEA
ncbi:aconitate hydratase [Verrucomicrobiaceae bacterium 5K15]|uniref:Aconitate hydratase A n=1 Tax=Oceaniferula flava TaxID=2800421 RepID=A0AAE2V8N0_9BACT|nr:aconitate hydratase [Oceaniferula flavus]MBK1853768.1 aconitate hydratase [Oceaniferula flavus]MBM1135075.1 aconitate hydratase [Oceaniferula flavus]